MLGSWPICTRPGQINREVGMNPPNILFEQAAAHRDPYDKELDGTAAQQERSTALDNPGQVHSRRARPRHSMSSRTLFGFILLLAIAAASPPTDAQQAPRIPKIGFLATAGQLLAPNIAAFRLGLRELGYVEGKTVLLEVRLSGDAVERLPQLARELVALKPDVIVATNDVAIASVRRETQTIPIVMAFSSDPAGAGFVASLARPGGNVTGLSTLSPETSGKRLELLREVVPKLSRVALL